MSEVSRPTWRGHLAIARIDHWVKNVFVIPGIVLAYTMTSVTFGFDQLLRVAVGLLSVSLVASANYTINELLDAEFDRQHPDKRDRPVASGQVHPRLAWLQWAVLLAAGCALGASVGPPLAWTLVALAIAGLAYNVRAVRTKEVALLDVISEAINNPIRLIAGWYMITIGGTLPPLSLCISYWFIGGYFMGLKRFAELRYLTARGANAPSYRSSFSWYTEERLLVSVMFYAATSMLFFGAFLMRYRMELVLTFPFTAWTMTSYFLLSFAEGSAVRRPEDLWRQTSLMVAVVATSAVFIATLTVDIPALREWFVVPGEVVAS